MTKKYTVAEVEQAFREWYADQEWFSRGPDGVELQDAYEEYWYEKSDHESLPGLGEVYVAEQFGGEGLGDSYFKVFKIEETDQYFRVDGWHASHVGSEIDGDLYEVLPQAKTITVYEAVDA